MIDAYMEPLKNALLIFPFLAFALTLPFLIYFYRKYGTLGAKRSLILYSFIFYLLCAYFLVILPLPKKTAVAAMTGPFMQLNPFASLENFLRNTTFVFSAPRTYLPALEQPVVLEPLFNLLLTLPFGVYLRYYFQQSLKKTLLFTFCLSLFFELTQLSGLYFYYPRPYRLFDVDDLIHNTLGGALGYALTPLFTALLPTRQEIDAEAFEKGHKVSYLRRLVAFLIDWLILDSISFVVTLVGQKIASGTLLENSFFQDVLAVCFYFGLLMYLLKGQTIGKKVVRIQVVGYDNLPPKFFALLKRYSLLYLFPGAITEILRYFDKTAANSVAANLFFVALLLTGGGLLFLFYGNLLFSVLTKKAALFYENISKTKTISLVAKDPA